MSDLVSGSVGSTRSSSSRWYNLNVPEGSKSNLADKIYAAMLAEDTDNKNLPHSKTSVFWHKTVEIQGYLMYE